MPERRFPPYLVLGYSEAAMLLNADQPPSVEAAICIHGQRDPVLNLDCKYRVDLTFDDCEMESEDDPFAAYRSRAMKRKAAEVGLNLAPPRESDVEAMIEFGMQTRDCKGLVLFQCHAGISRSAAAAIIALVQWYGPSQEPLAVESLRKVRPAASPPLDLIATADRLLQREGRILEAITRP